MNWRRGHYEICRFQSFYEKHKTLYFKFVSVYRLDVIKSHFFKFQSLNHLDMYMVDKHLFSGKIFTEHHALHVTYLLCLHPRALPLMPLLIVYEFQWNSHKFQDQINEWMSCSWVVEMVADAEARRWWPVELRQKSNKSCC